MYIAVAVCFSSKVVYLCRAKRSLPGKNCLKRYNATYFVGFRKVLKDLRQEFTGRRVVCILSVVLRCTMGNRHEANELSACASKLCCIHQRRNVINAHSSKGTDQQPCNPTKNGEALARPYLLV